MRTKPVVILSSLLAFIVAIVFLACGGQSPSSSAKRAVIVDQLTATDPNPAFIERTEEMLGEAGYLVDVVPPEDVTVDFYRQLPRGGYDLVILRTHSAALALRSSGIASSEGVTEEVEEIRPQLALFTNEPFSLDRHTDDLRQERLALSYYTGGSRDEGYFAITADFVRESMRGEFAGSTIVMVGCAGVASSDVADAFAARGAGTFVGWDDLVTAAHTDLATEEFLRHFLLEGRGLGAIQTTMTKLGPDPVYGGKLAAYTDAN